MRYYLTLGAVFKNEGHVLKEWIDHHYQRGFEHFYLINDQSTDNYREILNPYIEKNIVTLYENTIKKNGVDTSRQGRIYNTYLQKHLTDTFWMGIFDLDEFLWAPLQIDIQSILQKYEEYGSIEVNWLLFGSNGHIEQPSSVVEGFTRRADIHQGIWIKMPENQLVPKHWPFEISPDGRFYKNVCQGTKCIANTRYLEKDGLNVHGHQVTRPVLNISYKGKGELLMNHYYCQSEQFWKTIKQTRGSAGDVEDSYRDMDVFRNADTNDIEDTRLANQKMGLKS